MTDDDIIDPYADVQGENPDEVVEDDQDDLEENTDKTGVVWVNGATTKTQRRKRRPRPKLRRRGNTKADSADEARRDALVRATGRGVLVGPEAASWRTQMELGNRSKAAALLSDGTLTHNSGSGFGAC